MDQALTSIGNRIRLWMRGPARLINYIGRGHIRPNHITLVSLLGHFIVLQQLKDNHPVRAAVWLAFFAIMDSLDGALARVQKSSTATGILFDSVADRVKEVVLYIGITMFLYVSSTYGSLDYRLFSYYDSFWVGIPIDTWLPLAVCGLSLVVSYIRARGETILQKASKTKYEVNKVFVDGLARYEVRMTLIVAGLLTGSTFVVLHLLFVLLIVTALQRMYKVYRALSDV